MAEINLSAEQLDKLKAAMAKVKGADAQSPQAGQAAQPPQADAAAVRQQPTAPGVPVETVGETGTEESRQQVETNLAEGTYLRVDEDEMTAWLYLVPPKEDQTYTKREL